MLAQTETTQERVAQIQEWGEFALLAAPYYLTHLLEPVIVDTIQPTFVVGSGPRSWRSQHTESSGTAFDPPRAPTHVQCIQSTSK